MNIEVIDYPTVRVPGIADLAAMKDMGGGAFVLTIAKHKLRGDPTVGQEFVVGSAAYRVEVVEKTRYFTTINCRVISDG